MASISKQPNGRKMIQFIGQDSRRRSIRLGKVSMRQAEAIKHKVEELLSSNLSGCSVGRDTADWVGQLGDGLYEKFASVGLVQKRGSSTLAQFIDGYVQERFDVKNSTRLVYNRVRGHLVLYFGEHKNIREINSGDADSWRLSMLKRGLAENTVRKSCGVAKQFFTSACRKKILTENPFSDLVSVAKADMSRSYFVTREEASKVLLACPDAGWRLLFALARFGGLRVPSEALSLRWSDVDWCNGRLTVRSSKTEHHDGNGVRVLPIFPELKEHLLCAFELAEHGEEFCITRYRDKATNLRTQLNRIISRAGLVPWPKLWQNLRSTRETELANDFPMHVVTEWIGNSVAVAQKHYLQVTDDHFTKAMQKPMQYSHARGGFGRHGRSDSKAKSVQNTSIRKKTTQCINTGLQGMGHTGLEQ